MGDTSSSDSTDWVMDTSESASNEENIASVLSSDEYTFIGDMVFRKRSFMNSNIQYSMVTDKRRWVFRMMNRLYWMDFEVFGKN